MKNTLVSLLMMSLLLVLPACSGGDSADASEEDTSAMTDTDTDTDTDDAPGDLSAVMKEAEKAMKQAGMNQETEPVNFRELKTILPEKMQGMEMTDQSGETTGAMGFTISQAEAIYEEEDGKRIEVRIADTGGITMAMMGLAAWASVTIDREDSDGYERTTTINGHKALEKYSKRNNSGEIAILVDERFIVTIEGRNIDMKDLRAAVKSIQIDKLQKLS